MYFKKSLIACFAILLMMTIGAVQVEAANEFDGDDLRLFSSGRVFTQGCVCIKGLDPNAVKLSSYLCSMAPHGICDKNSELGNDSIRLNEQKCYSFKGRFLIRKAGKAKVVDYKTDGRDCGEGQLNMLN